MKVLIITDTSFDQINGVVTTLKNTIKGLESNGYTDDVITPDNNFKTISLPTYKEIKVAINPWKIRNMILKSNADFIHVATEGPLGLFATNFLRKVGKRFTTSYHTKMPEYVHARFKCILTSWGYAYMKHIHKKSSNILVTTPSMKDELIKHGFDGNITVWNRGVDTTLFNPENREIDSDTTHFLYVGRISVEKNIQAFLDMDIIGIKHIVGDGPLLNTYKTLHKNNSNIIFHGAKMGKDLQQAYVNADVLVFPSLTDTYGIVMLEAMACGTPVAAFKVTGPIDCVTDGITGFVKDDLKAATLDCLYLDRALVAEYGSKNTWDTCTKTFIASLARA